MDASGSIRNEIISYEGPLTARRKRDVNGNRPVLGRDRECEQQRSACLRGRFKTRCMAVVSCADGEEEDVNTHRKEGGCRVSRAKGENERLGA